MAQTFNNGESLASIRAKLNANAGEIDIKEPEFTKNTAFNKNFGTTAGTVLEGSKDVEYAKKASANTFTDTIQVQKNANKIKLIGTEGNASTTFEQFLTFQNGDFQDFLSMYRNNNGTSEFLGIEAPSYKPIVFQEFGGNVGINKRNPGSKLAVVGLPTSATGLTSGDVWRNGTVLNIIA